MKAISTIILAIFLACTLATAQDTMYVYRAGTVISKQAVADVDSVIFYKPITPPAVVTDIDGNVYHTVTIGTQTWMVENLKTTKYNDGTSIPNITDSSAWWDLSTPGYCFYNNDAANKTIYGALYNWYTVKTGKLAPTGWHVPTDAEWTTLENYLIANGFNYDGTTIGNKIAKSLAATTLWNIDTTEGAIGNDLTKNNTSGFAGLPGGFRGSNGTFYIGYNGSWWSSTERSTYNAWYRYLYYIYSFVSRSSNSKQGGFSVRCIRDSNTTVLGTPTLSTTALYNIKTTSAAIGGIITSDGGSAITARGVCWNTTGSPTTADRTTTDGALSGFFRSSITGLTPGTTYYIRAWATNSFGTGYGNVVSIKTKNEISPTFDVIDIDGNGYHTVKIGTQIWMVENLKTTKYNDDTSIPYVTDATAWEALSTPGYCFYNNDVANKNNYGALYNWYTVNTGKLAPTGWHVPTDAEWTTLENYLIANGYNYDGTTTGNKIAKSLADTTLWNTGTTVGAIGNDLTINNTTGFAGLPGGFRGINGSFGAIGDYGSWWGSTEYSTSLAWFRTLGCYDSNVTSYYNYKQYGFSVRCLRDN